MRGRRQGLAAVVVAVATLAAGYGEAVQATQAGASAPQAERPTLEGGYSLTFTNPKVGEWDDIYRGKEGNLLVFEDVYHGKFFKWYATEDLNTVKSVGRKTEFEHDPHNGVLNFPLSVGKKWTHYYTNTVGRNVAQRTAWAEVKAYEQVTVPAGTFWAYRIERVNQRAGVPQPAYETYWYSPEVKFFVKYFSREFGWEYELVKYGKEVAP